MTVLRSRLLAPLASTRGRIFVTCWILFAVHFAPNVVREHYPAFALVSNGNYRLDEYVGFHSDIFVHQGDGHAYINNNVGASVVAAIPLLIFRPVLDALEAHSKRLLKDHPAAADPPFVTKYPNREKFMRIVREHGLDLRFGAAAAITATLVMAPLSALMALFIFDQLRRRGVSVNRATILSFVFAFGTPVFFRTAHLNHNMMVMYGTFGAFCALATALEGTTPLTDRRAFVAGVLCGAGTMCDYSGTIPTAVFGLAVLKLSWAEGLGTAIRRGAVYSLGALLLIAIQLHSQWACFGSWIHPPQTWMAAANFTDLGYRGFAPPAPDLLLDNLFEHRWGLFAYGPILVLGLWPPRRAPDAAPGLARRTWVFAMSFALPFMLFCASNQYARMQWNTGVRYLLPLVPFLFLGAANVLARLPGWLLAAIAVPAVLHEWVLCLRRDCDIPGDWAQFLQAGPRLPWLDVLSRSPAGRTFAPEGSMPAMVVLALTLAAITGLWWLGRKAEARRAATASTGTTAA